MKKSDYVRKKMIYSLRFVFECHVTTSATRALLTYLHNKTYFLTLLLRTHMKKTKKTDSYSHILKYTGLFGGVQGVNILVGIVRNKLVATILGPAGMGLISLFNSTINLLANSTNLGISMSAVKNISEAYDNEDKTELERMVRMVRSWCVITGLAGMLLCIVLSHLLSKWTFGWGDHTLHFILLSPIVAMMAVTGGEMAILKGMRKLKNLAYISFYNVLAALFTSVPLYYYFGEKAIVPSLVLMAFTQMALTIGYSYRIFPFSYAKDRHSLNKGMSMVRLGIAFVVAGILGSGAEFVIRSFLSYYTSSLDMVGLYSAGYMMTMVYAGMVFSAMETDFFPRLSACHNLSTTTSTVVNRQIEVSFLLVSPMLVFFTIMLPILIPLLYSGKFTPAISMMQVTMFAMYFRAIKLPISYLPLAKGDSMSYLLLEAIYDILLVIGVVLAFIKWELLGCGIAITIVGIIDFVVILFYARYKYGYRMSCSVRAYAMMQLPFGILAYLVTFIRNPWWYWGLGILLGCASLVTSILILRQKTSLWQSLVSKVKKRFSHESS